MSSFFVSSLSYFLVVLMVSFIVLVIMVLTDLYSGGYPHNVAQTMLENIIFTEFTKSYKTSCKALLLMYIIIVTKNILFLKLAYKLSKKSCEYSRC